MTGRDADGGQKTGMADLLRRWRDRLAGGRPSDTAVSSEMAVWDPPEDAPGWTSEEAPEWAAARRERTAGTPWVDTDSPPPTTPPSGSKKRR